MQETIKLLNNGHVVAMPTETVYGLGALMYHPEAVDRIFHLKGRPANNPLIIHVATVQQVENLATEFPKGFRQLVEAFWPGPMTLILKANTERIPSRVRAGLETAAFRIPSHPLMLEVLKQAFPLVMPSANLSGKPSATQPEHIKRDFGSDFPILDGGTCLQGIESTILAFTEGEWCIARQGALFSEAFEPVLGYKPKILQSKEKPICPGQQYRHYAPKAQLHLCQGPLDTTTEVILGFQDRQYVAPHIYSLGSIKDPASVAQNLYHALRQLDEDQISEVAVDMNFPDSGLWQVIRERLIKAASS